MTYFRSVETMKWIQNKAASQEPLRLVPSSSSNFGTWSRMKSNAQGDVDYEVSRAMRHFEKRPLIGQRLDPAMNFTSAGKINN